MSTKVKDYLQMEEVINKPYLDAQDITVLVPICISYARKYIHIILDEMREDGVMIFNGKHKVVPKERVLRKFGISESTIRKNAKAMREMA